MKRYHLFGGDMYQSDAGERGPWVKRKDVLALLRAIEEDLRGNPSKWDAANAALHRVAHAIDEIKE